MHILMHVIVFLALARITVSVHAAGAVPSAARTNPSCQDNAALVASSYRGVVGLSRAM